MVEQICADVRDRDPQKSVSRMRAYSNWQWHLNEVSVKISGETHYLWRTVDHEGEVLESYVRKRRDRKAALKFLRKSMKRYGRPEVNVSDKLRSYGAAMKVIGNADKQETGRWLSNRAENSHLPFRRRERAMLRFRQMRSLQNSPQSIRRSAITSTRNVTFTLAPISSSTVPRFAQSIKRLEQKRWPHKFNLTMPRRFQSRPASRICDREMGLAFRRLLPKLQTLVIIFNLIQVNLNVFRCRTQYRLVGTRTVSTLIWGLRLGVGFGRRIF